MVSNTLQPLHSQPLQSFKVIEDLTMALRQEILRLYGNCMTMWGDTICEDEAISLSIREMDDTVREYESNVPYHACGQGGIRIWAGVGDRVKQAALWSKLKDKGAHPDNPRAQYRRIVTQVQEEVVWCDKCSVVELKTGGVLFNSVPSSDSLAEELGALNLDKDDRKGAESWRGGRRLGKLKRLCSQLQPLLHSSEETCGGSTGTSKENSNLTPSPEPVDQCHGEGKDGSGVLLRNEYGCYRDSDGICCCPCPGVVYL